MNIKPPEVWICARDFNASATFYTEVLGFEMRLLKSNEAAILTFENQEINLGSVFEPWPDKLGKLEYPLGRGCQFYFNISDISNFKARLEQFGIQPPRKPWSYVSQTNQKVIFEYIDVLDPDGYLLTFREERNMFEVN